MHRLEIKRQMSADDIAVVSGLLADVEHVDGHRPIGDHTWLDLVQGGRAGFAGLVAWESGHDHPVAYAQVSRGNDSWGLELVVHPHHRDELATIGPELLGEALAIVGSEGGGHVHWWVFAPTDLHRRVAEQVGLRPGRRLHQMRRPLPTGLAHGIVTRAFVVGQDEAAWLEVNNRAFLRHPEQGGWSLDTLQAREREPWFDAGGFRLHEIDGQLAGFCWTKVHVGEHPVLGEIYVIAVDPAFHRRGLGRALTLAGLEHLSAVGVTTGMLYVDADNVGAIAVYEGLDFVLHHDDQAFVGDIEARPH
jgi:mycothiol synthase